ncbi:hypothetical protein BPOR_1086g00010 [Botrytis porri]|uniref:Uncharacterized protein n=1 Tax=Botrytis porri TaxID=87229 RepID=A0A4Z1KK77_9HELO|nr:hypothetical protein BPOR_1086g00010 [Botrytis porri]
MLTLYWYIKVQSRTFIPSARDDSLQIKRSLHYTHITSKSPVCACDEQQNKRVKGCKHVNYLCRCTAKVDQPNKCGERGVATRRAHEFVKKTQRDKPFLSMQTTLQQCGLCSRHATKPYDNNMGSM